MPALELNRLTIAKIERRRLHLWLILLLGLIIQGCANSTYDEGRDTVQAFGNGRYQVCEGSPKSFCITDEKVGQVIATGIVAWQQQGHLAYVVGANPLRFYIVDVPQEQMTVYHNLTEVPAESRTILKSLWHNRTKSHN